MKKGSLTIVGSGIKFASHMTIEAKAYLEHADLVLMMVSDPTTEEWIQSLNKNTIDLVKKFYKGSDKRTTIYSKIAKFIAGSTTEDKNVCAVFYGHPGVFVQVSHEAIKLTKEKGIPATLLPGISAEDCLYADLNIDPAKGGCQQYEVTQFLVEQPKFDTHASLILWQIGSLGQTHVVHGDSLQQSTNKLSVLKNYLLKFYPENHLITMYIAAIYPGEQPMIATMPLSDIELYQVTGDETMFVPYYGKGSVDKEMLSKLGLTMEDITSSKKPD